MRRVVQIAIGGDTERFITLLRSRSDRWPALDEGGPGSGWSQKEIRRYSRPLLREHGGSFELRKREVGNGNRLSPFMRLDIDYKNASVRCSLRRPSVWLLVALLMAIFGSVALASWVGGGGAAATGFLFVGLTVASLGAVLVYGLAKGEESSLLGFVRQTAVDAARETDVPD